MITANKAFLNPFLPKSEIDFEALSPKELRQTAMAFAKETLTNTVVQNKTFDFPIVLTHQGLKNTINESRENYVHKLLALTCLPAIIEDAKLISTETDKHGKPNIHIYRFLGAVFVENIAYTVWIVVKQTPERIYLYDYGLK
jgi:hypothetical protein